MKLTCLSCECRAQFLCSLSLRLFESAAALTGALTVVNLLQCTNMREKTDFLEVLIAVVSSAKSLY